MPPTRPGEMTDLTAQILAVVDTSPGVTTNVLCKQVQVRKTDVLAELERLRQLGLLRVEDGHWAPKCWCPVRVRGNLFRTCSRRTPKECWARPEPRTTVTRLVSARELADVLNVKRSFVYEHAGELGAIRLGTGPKARLRFDLATSLEKLICHGDKGVLADG